MSIKNIAVSIAGGAESLITVKYAIYFAKILNAKLTAIYVVDEYALKELLKSKVFVEIEAQDYEKDLEEQGVRFMQRAKKMAELKGVEFESAILRGVIHEEVVEKVRQLEADILIIGQLKEVFSRREIFYDEGERIFREAPCPIIVVKEPEKVLRLYRDLPDKEQNSNNV